MAYKNLPLLFFSLLFGVPFAHSQEFKNVTQFGSTGFDNAVKMETDANGNKYIAAYFTGTATFGSTTLVSDGGVDIVVIKMNKNDNVLWAKKIGSSASTDFISDLAIDGNGNIYLIGSYQSSIVVYDDNGDLQATHNQPDVFFVHYNAQGGVVEAGNFAFSVPLTAQALDVSSGGTVYAAGAYNSNSTTDPDIWVARLPFNSITPWVQVIGGTSPEYVNALRVDDNGYINIAGAFSGTLEFGNFSTGSITASGSVDGFIASLNDNITLESVLRVPGVGSTDFASIYDMRYDGNEIYLTGVFGGEIEFGSITLTALGSNVQTFYSKLRYVAATDVFQIEYANKLDATGDCRPSSVGFTSIEEMCLTGQFTNRINYGTNERVTSRGDEDIFYAKIDVDGDVDFMLSAGSSVNNDRSFGLTVYNDDVSICGFFTSSASFSDVDLTSAGDADMFIADISEVVPAVNLSNVPASICQGQEMDLQIDAVLIDAGNEFKVYLSDENGDFTNQTLLGTRNSAGGGFVSVSFDEDLEPSAEYRLSVESTNPPLTSIYAENLEIFPLAEELLIIGRVEVETLSEESYSVKDIPTSTFYWEVENGNQIAGGNTNSIDIQWANKGEGRVRVYHETENGCESLEQELVIEVQNSVSLPEATQELSLYPIPTQNELVIDGISAQNAVQSYTVFDITGKVMVVSQQLAAGSAATQLVVDVSQLQTGVYFIKMQMNDEVVVKEFQKL